jgi:hypothetical protein
MGLLEGSTYITCTGTDSRWDRNFAPGPPGTTKGIRNLFQQHLVWCVKKCVCARARFEGKLFELAISHNNNNQQQHQTDGVPFDQGVICIYTLMNTLNDDVQLSCRLGLSGTYFVMPVRGFGPLDPGNMCLMAFL